MDGYKNNWLMVHINNTVYETTYIFIELIFCNEFIIRHVIGK